MNEVVLVCNWRYGVELKLKGGFRDGSPRLKAHARTYLVPRRNQIRFVHVDHLKSARCESPSCSVGERGGTLFGTGDHLEDHVDMETNL